MSSARVVRSFDARSWTDRSVVFDQLLSALPLPSYCGRNLDALADALWELPPCTIVVTHVECLGAEGPLALWGVELMRTLAQASLDGGARLEVVFVR